MNWETINWDRPPIALPTKIEQYIDLEERMKKLSHYELMNAFWLLARIDLFFLVRYILSTKEYFRSEFGIVSPQWILDRCREVQFESDRVVDIWARFHWKSNIKTFANIIRKILIDPDITILILSHTRPNAKKFHGQIQREFLGNELLRLLSWHPKLGKQILPDEIKDYQRFSLDEGTIVNRVSNPKEATIEAAGLVDSLPQGPHYRIRAIDDAVTPSSVTTAEMKEKTLAMWELSQPLGMPSGDDEEWITGTFYAYDDAYHDMVRRGYKLRLHPCFAIDEENTKRDEDGMIVKLSHHMDQPVLYSAGKLMELIRDMGAEEGSKNASLQMYCDPSAGVQTGFDLEWVNYYDAHPREEGKNKNIYILVDPANEKKERYSKSSYTAMMVVGLGEDGNYYILDMVRDRMNLRERTDALFRLHRRWKPIEVRYEKLGFHADIDHIEYVQSQVGYRFKIIRVKDNAPKQDRINRLQPLFEQGKVFMPRELIYRTVEAEAVDLVKTFLKEEYAVFPNTSSLDMLDALARIVEPGLRLVWPRERELAEGRYHRRKDRPRLKTSWMAA